MSGYNFPVADFAPQLVGYTGQGTFRFWCQKVLPIVYDDSLSYYELLCKVINYLNNLIEDLKNTEANVSGLYEAFVALQKFVNDYFDNLEIDEVITDKLESMAISGELTRIIFEWLSMGFMNYVTPELFGAKGDGEADDSVAIKNASETNLTVVFGTKTYLCHDVVVEDKNVHWVGNNTTIKLVPIDDVNNQFRSVILVNNGDFNAEGIMVEGLGSDVHEMVGEYPNQTVFKAWRGSVYITNCVFHNIYTAMHHDSDSLFVDRVGFLVTGISSPNFVIRGNKFIECGGDEITFVCRERNDYTTSVVFDDNIVEDVEGYSFNFDGTTISFCNNKITRFIHRLVSVTNFNGDTLYFRGNVIVDSEYTSLIDCYEGGYQRVKYAFITDNYSDSEWGTIFFAGACKNAVLRNNYHLGRSFASNIYNTADHSNVSPYDTTSDYNPEMLEITNNTFVYSYNENNTAGDRYFFAGLTNRSNEVKRIGKLDIKGNVIDFSRYDNTSSAWRFMCVVQNCDNVDISDNTFKGRIITTGIGTTLACPLRVMETTELSLIFKNNTIISPTATESNTRIMTVQHTPKFNLFNAYGNIIKNDANMYKLGMPNYPIDSQIKFGAYNSDFFWVCGGTLYDNKGDVTYSIGLNNVYRSVKNVVDSIIWNWLDFCVRVNVTIPENEPWLPAVRGTAIFSKYANLISGLYLAVNGAVYTANKGSNGNWSEWVQLAG